jgi:hypothetical protein
MLHPKLDPLGQLLGALSFGLQLTTALLYS